MRDAANSTGEDEFTYKQLAESIIEIVESVIDSYADKLIDMAIHGKVVEVPNPRHPDNFLSTVDLELHSIYRSRLSEVFPSFIYASEEGDPHLYPAESAGPARHAIVVDPLDTSELAVRGLFGYTHVVVYSMLEQLPVIAVVGDMFHSVQIYCAYRTAGGDNKAFMKMRNGTTYTLTASRQARLNGALVTNYSMRPQERFRRLAKEEGFLNALAATDDQGNRQGRIGVDFGSVSLCHVAAGFTDATVEFAKGFSLWDLYPGQYILESAGGIVTSLDGKRLPLDLSLKRLEDVNRSMNRRQKFVAAGTADLAREISAVLVGA